MEDEKKNKHKYSTYVLLGIVGLITMVVLVEGIDGMGTVNYVSKFIYGGVISNSSLLDDMPNGTTINISTICTSTNGLCVSGGSGGNPFNQELNKSSNVTFNQVNISNSGYLGGNSSCMKVYYNSTVWFGVGKSC